MMHRVSDAFFTRFQVAAAVEIRPVHSNTSAMVSTVRCNLQFVNGKP